MTTTTKIFVILVCLFAFIFTPLAIQFAAQKHNWRELANDYRSDLEIAYANERSVMAIAASEIERHKALRDKQYDSLLALQQEAAQLERQIADLTQERDQSNRSRDDWETSARLLTAEMAVKTRHNQELNDAKEKALARERELQARNLQLNDRVKELSAQLVVVTQQLNQKLQEIVAYREENKQLRHESGLGLGRGPLIGSPAPSAQAKTPAASSPIYGTVTRVEGSLATLDVGSASGLSEGSEMVVLRNNDWICDLRITSQITPQEAVGEVMVGAEDKQIRSGDQVQDVLSFEGSR